MNADWFRHADVKNRAAFANALAGEVFKAAGIRALPMRSGGTAESRENHDLVLFHASFKTGPVFYRAKKQNRHGMNADSWQECKRLTENHVGPACLLIFEAFTNEFGANWSGALLLQSTKNLGLPFWGRNEIPHKVYWPRKSFAELHHFTAGEAYRAAQGTNVPALCAQITEVLTPQKQAAMF